MVHSRYVIWTCITTNILVDDDFNITGIIDWSDAQTVPLECSMISPEFVTFPGLPPEKNATIVAFREKFGAALRMREVGTEQDRFWRVLHR
jgi:hypothetical protein